MVGTVDDLWLAAIVFVGSHVALASTPVRAVLVGAFGEGAFRGVYSLAALAAIVWLVLAFNAAPPGQLLWSLGGAAAYLVAVIVPVALVLVIGGLSQPNPTIVGREKLLDEPGTGPSGVLRITRNPIMWGIGLWALAHLAAAGTMRGLAFFGAFALLAIAGSYLLDAKGRQRHGAKFAPFELMTSNLPFAAILQGRQKLGAALGELGWLRLLIVVVLWALLLHGHGWLFGTYPFG